MTCKECIWIAHCGTVPEGRKYKICDDFEDGIDREIAKDMNGIQIFEGDTVAWYDLERGYVGEFDVEGRPTEELVKIKNLFSEAEVPPEELEVINKQ